MRISVDGRPNRRNKAAFSDFSGEVRTVPEPCPSRIFKSQVVNVLTHIAITGLNLRHKIPGLNACDFIVIWNDQNTPDATFFPGSSLLFKMTSRHFENPRGEGPGDEVAHDVDQAHSQGSP